MMKLDPRTPALFTLLSTTIGLSACAPPGVGAGETGTAETGTSEGDGDGEPSGDGDGEPSGDGDGEPSGDGDGEPLPEPCEVVQFGTPELEAAIRAELNLGEQPEPVSGAQLELLTELELEGPELLSVDGLECATGLTTLGLTNGAPESLEPIAALPELARVRLVDLSLASAADSEAITGRQELARLTLQRVEGFELDALPLASGLEQLNYTDSEVGDIGPLAAVPSLEILDLSTNLITELEPLAGLTGLRGLDLSANPVADISPIAGLLMLEELSLAEDPVTSLAPLAGHPALRSLDIYASSVEALVELPVLEVLYAGQTSIDSLEVFAGHEHIVTLRIHDTEVSSLDALAGVESLEQLLCWNCQITGLAPDIHASSVILANNQISDLGPITTWAKPVEWSFIDNEIDDLSPLTAVPWVAEAPDCAFVFVAQNPLGAPGNPASVAEACANSGMTVLGGEDALSCEPLGCELPNP